MAHPLREISSLTPSPPFYPPRPKPPFWPQVIFEDDGELEIAGSRGRITVCCTAENLDFKKARRIARGRRRPTAVSDTTPRPSRPPQISALHKTYFPYGEQRAISTAQGPDPCSEQEPRHARTESRLFNGAPWSPQAP